jgi:hypothetical protein
MVTAPTSRRSQTTILSCLATGLAVLVLAGCPRPASDSGSSLPLGGIDDSALNEDLFRNTIESLNRMPELMDFSRYGDPQIMADTFSRLRRWRETGEPAFGWEPSPDEEILKQIVDWINQWAGVQPVPSDWQADPLLESLPNELQQLPSIQALNRMNFNIHDGRTLMEAVWLRNVSEMVKDGLDDPGGGDKVALASALFDWTVRNIQLDPDGGPDSPLLHFPWQIVFYGHGTAADRMWVFIRLARQQQIPAVVLGLPDPQSADGIRPWCVGVLDQGELYVFDPRLGLPIPGPAAGPDDRDALLRRPATLSQLASDDRLLRQLDLDGAAYPIRADDLRETVVLLEAMPSDVSPRMRLIEQRLTGTGRLVLSVNASQMGQSIAGLAGVSEVRLWTRPFRTIELHGEMPREVRELAYNEFTTFLNMPFLWKARSLHLYGLHDGTEGANQLYMNSRPPKQFLETQPADSELRMMAEVGKQCASYWLGLSNLDRGNLSAAEDFFRKRTIEDWPAGIWTDGAAYNLGRSFEITARKEHAEERADRTKAEESRTASDKKLADAATRRAERDERRAVVLTKESEELRVKADEWTRAADADARTAENYRSVAIDQYRSRKGSPQSHGDQLRALWLQSSW